MHRLCSVYYIVLILSTIYLSTEFITEERTTFCLAPSHNSRGRRICSTHQMFLVSPDVRNNNTECTTSRSDKDEKDGLLSSDLIKHAYAKERSGTGVSLSPTETSSSTTTSSRCLDHGWSRQDSLSSDDPSPFDQDNGEAFFDCLSRQGSSPALLAYDDAAPSHDNTVALYQNGMCVYPNGQPAFVPPGTQISTPNPDFIFEWDPDRPKAQRMWQATQKWRKEKEIWKIHTKPNRRFHHSKKNYPSCYHGYDKAGVVIEFSFPGQMNPSALFPNKTVMEEVMHHHYFMQEYAANCLYTHPDTWHSLGKEPMQLPDSTTTSFHKMHRGVVMLVDLKDAGPSLLTRSMFMFIKGIITVGSEHYPGIHDKVLVINAPFWVAGAFATIRPLIPDNLPVEIASSKNTLKLLRDFIDDDQIPLEYGGSSPYRLHEHPFETRLHQFAEKAGNTHNQQLQQQQQKEQQETAEISTSAFLDDSGSVRLCATTTRDSSALSEAEDRTKKANASNLGCVPLLHRNDTQRHQPTFVFESECDELLVLTPREQSFELFAVARNFWDSLVNGFEGCSRRN